MRRRLAIEGDLPAAPLDATPPPDETQDATLLDPTLAEALTLWRDWLSPETPSRIRAFFEANWSFEAIGRQALTAYQQLTNKRAATHEDRAYYAGRV